MRSMPAPSLELITHPERLAAVEQRLNDHEACCEERLAEIKATATTTLKAVEGLKSRFWTITLSMLAWALTQLWTGNHIDGVRSAVPRLDVTQDVSDVDGR